MSTNPSYEELQQRILELEQSVLEHKKASQSEEEKSCLWLENSPVSTKIVDLNFNLQYMSSSGVRELKIDDITEYYGKPYPLSFYPDSFKIPMRKNLRQAIKTGEVITQEAPIVDVEGRELWYHSTIVPVYTDQGQLDYIMVVSLETTARKQAEEALLESRERFKDIAESMSDWIWEVDADAKYTYSSSLGSHILGYKYIEIIGKTPFDFMDYDEAKRAGALFGKIIAEKKPFRDLVFCHIHKDGHKVYLSTSGVPILDKEGNLLGYRGVDSDITERKQVEKELRKLSVAVTQSPASVVITDALGTIEYVNPKFLKVTGYGFNEVIGQKPSVLKSGEHRDSLCGVRPIRFI
jgi:PAS domain S-box-containing protein